MRLEMLFSARAQPSDWALGLQLLALLEYLNMQLRKRLRTQSLGWAGGA